MRAIIPANIQALSQSDTLYVSITRWNYSVRYCVDL